MWRDPKQYKCSGPWFKFNNDLFKVHCVRFCCLLYYHGLLRGLIYASTPLCAFSFKQHFHFQPNYGSEIKIDGNAENFTLMPERNALKHRVRSNLQNYRILSCIHFLVTVFQNFFASNVVHIFFTILYQLCFAILFLISIPRRPVYTSVNTRTQRHIL